MYALLRYVLGSQAMSVESSPTPSFSLDRIRHLVSDLEQELAAAPDDSPRVQALKMELEALKQLLSDNDTESHQVTQQLRGTHNVLDDLMASVEGEILRDTPYLAEMGRILGLV
jgi:ABC-type transporter Mla subunit MlaD